MSVIDFFIPERMVRADGKGKQDTTAVSLPRSLHDSHAKPRGQGGGEGGLHMPVRGRPSHRRTGQYQISFRPTESDDVGHFYVGLR
jgi:hypothetical protein